MPGLSGVGISFGADRIYDVLNQLDLYPAEATSSTEVMFANFRRSGGLSGHGHDEDHARRGIACEIYPDVAKMKKQMTYANAKSIPYVALVGEEEMKQGKLTLKSMANGEQTLVTPQEAIRMVAGH